MLTFPGKFEQKNNISVNVYTIDQKEHKGTERQVNSRQYQKDVEETNLSMMKPNVMKKRVIWVKTVIYPI